MKKAIFNQRIVRTLVGVVLAMNMVWGANAQEVRSLAAKHGGHQLHPSFPKTDHKDKEELMAEPLNVIEEVPTVSFINKNGEVVAVLYGAKSVLKEIYKEDLSKSYFLSAYGNHEVYLIK